MVTAGTLFAIAIDGLAFGAFLALLGVAITLVFGLGDVLNLAIGTFSVLTVLIATVLIRDGHSLLVASVAAVLAIAIFGLVVDQVLLSLVYRSSGDERILVGIFTTLGLAIFLDGALVNGFSFTWLPDWLFALLPGWLGVPAFPSSYSLPLNLPAVQLGGAPVTGSSLLIIVVVTAILVVLFAFLKATFVGMATRTVFQDERGAALVGVNPRRIRTLIFVLSVVVAGLGGLVFAFGSALSVASGFTFTVYALIVSIVGGVRSVTGTVAAGFLLGLVNQFANFFVGSYVAAIILFATAIAVILLKPEVLAS